MQGILAIWKQPKVSLLFHQFRVFNWCKFSQIIVHQTTKNYNRIKNSIVFKGPQDSSGTIQDWPSVVYYILPYIKWGALFLMSAYLPLLYGNRSEVCKCSTPQGSFPWMWSTIAEWLVKDKKSSKGIWSLFQKQIEKCFWRTSLADKAGRFYLERGPALISSE